MELKFSGSKVGEMRGFGKQGGREINVKRGGLQLFAGVLGQLGLQYFKENDHQGENLWWPHEDWLHSGSCFHWYGE